MPLPNVNAWLIDYRTVSGIFRSQNNARISHCMDLASSGRLFVVHTEEHHFKSTPALKAAFIQGHNCVHEPDNDIYSMCQHIVMNHTGKPFLQGDETPIFLAATAVVKKFGIISDCRETRFCTARDICSTYGISSFCSDEYFSLLSKN